MVIRMFIELKEFLHCLDREHVITQGYIHAIYISILQSMFSAIEAQMDF